MSRGVVLGLVALYAIGTVDQPGAPPTRGFTGVDAVHSAYDSILNAEFAGLAARLADTCGPAPPEACHTLEAAGLWWRIALEPESRAQDAALSRLAARAIDAAESWTAREPQRAEAWFYLGASRAVRAQWRVLRDERLDAAREGARIKRALERALALDPDMHDANVGLGLYQYYAAVAPRALRWLRWLLLLPGGNRQEGLARLLDARTHGQILAGEAEYQLHQIYLWYERRTDEALVILRDLQQRYPRNPLFYEAEAAIEDVYRHDAARSLAVSTRLLALATEGRVNEPALAAARARLTMAIHFERQGDRTRAIATLRALIDATPAPPPGVMARARALLAAWTTRDRA